MKTVEIYSFQNQSAAFDGSCFCIHFIRDGFAWGVGRGLKHPLVRDGFLIQNIGTSLTIQASSQPVFTICLPGDLIGDESFGECLTPHDFNLDISISCLLSNLRRSDPSDRELQAKLIFDALVHARDRSREKFFLHPSKAASVPMAAAREFVLSNLSNSPTIAEIASHCGYSPYHFSRLFAEFHGMSLGAYILQEKVRRACRQLVLTQDSIPEIAMSSGFLSPTSFAGTFKAKTRFTPSAFRRITARHRSDLGFFVS